MNKRNKLILPITIWSIIGVLAVTGMTLALITDAGKFLQFVVTGISVGMVYALIALGFALIWKSSSVANLALGQIVLISAWFNYSMFIQRGLPVLVALLLVIVFAILLGWLIERFTLRPLIGQPILSLIAVTLGIGYFLDGLVTFIWPSSTAGFGSKHIFPQEGLHIGPAVISQEFVWVIVICLAIFILLTLFFRYHKMGIAMRATADDQMAVQACGIPVTKVFSTSWMLACLVAAIGGILISSIGGISHGLVDTGLKSFSVVILGGLDSFIGAMVAGPIIGLAENVGGGYLGSVISWGGIQDIIPFVIIIIVMVFKPFGLFGEKRIERI
jgi:branched-chain amino acid transport system permease protein